ncbi:hypothetical protein Sango_1565100 [Sesamum angolense]|uniref:Uncharacterized protein n=1 Tax=Sesamum angolense TaxID=2727404 RepID=A0AAE1WPR8_9LAMI|nr:hypothetical protein Sango_1565100 [Sesamum angolense]
MDWAQRMVFYAVGPSYFVSFHEGVADDGTGSCLWMPSQLGVIAELWISWNIFDRIYDRRFQWANRILPSDHTLPGDYYNTKKLVKDLGLFIEKIHACKNGCMLYWKDDIDFEYCKFCGDTRYKLARGRTHMEEVPVGCP